MRAHLLPIVLLAALLGVGVPAAGAASAAGEDPAFSFRLDRQSAPGSGLLRLRMEAGSAGGAAAGFRVRLQYDDSALQFLEAAPAARLGEDTVRVNGDSDPVYAVYVCDVKGKSAPKLSGTVMTFTFQVKNGAGAGSAFFRADVDEICDFDGAPLAPDVSSVLELETEPALSGEAYLTALEPSVGELEPEFDPDILEYRLAVDAAVNSVVFRADAAEGGKAVVSRRTLHAAGSETEIAVTVTSADGSAEARYVVTVERAPKPPASSAPSSRPVSGAAGRPPKPPPEEEPAASETAGGGFLSDPEPGPVPGARPVSGARPAASGTDEPFPAAAPREEGEAVSPAEKKTEPAAARAGDLVVVGDRMPAYLVGMLAAGFCIMTGIALHLWLSSPKQ